MAWVEQRGTGWRVRYPDGDGGYGSVSGFSSRTAAEEYARDLETDQRRGCWIDPAGAKVRLSDWLERWIGTIDVEPRTEENYRRCLCAQIRPRWGKLALGEIKPSAVAEWLKQLHESYAAATVNTIRTIMSMVMDDAVDEGLIRANPVPRRRRRGRRRDRATMVRERVWAMPEHVIRIAEQATMLGGRSA